MKQYLEALEQILENGVDREGRNGKTRSIFGMQQRYDLSDGFPAVTTKKLYFKAVKSELLFFLEGGRDDNRLKELNDSKKTVWTANAEADYWKPKAKFEGDLGRIYGVQWRSWRDNAGNEIDQLGQVIEDLKNNPHSRRHIVVAWNPGELDQMALPPCHTFFQFFVAENKLSLQMYQRSADFFLGVPFNIASYAMLLAMVAQVTGLEQGEFIHTFGDAHIYHDHFDAVREQLLRTPKQLPTLWLNPEINDIDSFTMTDIKLENYQHDDPIRAKMAV